MKESNRDSPVDSVRPTEVARKRRDYATNTLKLRKSDWYNYLGERFGHQALLILKEEKEKCWMREITVPVP